MYHRTKKSPAQPLATAQHWKKDAKNRNRKKDEWKRPQAAPKRTRGGEKVDECGSQSIALGTKQLPIFTFDSSRHHSPLPQSHERVYAPASNQSSETPWRLASCERLTPQVYHARGSIPDALRPPDASIAPARQQASIH